jgi:competence protein ComEA
MDIASAWRVYRVPIVLGGVSIFCVILAIILFVKSIQSSTPIYFSRMSENDFRNSAGIDNQGSKSANLRLIFVDIEGAVVKPGIVSLPIGSRVEDVIQLAGGLQKAADTIFVAQNINRALKVSDGMKIYIPFQNDTSHIIDFTKQISETSHNLSPLLRPPNGGSQNGGGISINMASKDQLDTLPGVGPVTAQKIIDSRPYESLDDLVNKKAVGSALFEKIQLLLSL